MVDVVRQLDAQPGLRGSRPSAWASPGWSTAPAACGSAPTCPGRNVDVGVELARRLGLPVRVDNDATCAAWGEHLAGAARGADDAVLVTLGTGIGAGIIVDGELVRGANGFAGEAGHMVVDPRGPLCPAGAAAAGSGTPRAAGSAGWAARPPRPAGSAAGSSWPAATPSSVRGEHVTAAARRATRTPSLCMREFAGGSRSGWPTSSRARPALVVIGGGWSRRARCCSTRARRLRRQVMAPEDRPRTCGSLRPSWGSGPGPSGAALLGGLEASAIGG